jgi:hypothetical protein
MVLKSELQRQFLVEQHTSGWALTVTTSVQRNTMKVLGSKNLIHGCLCHCSAFSIYAADGTNWNYILSSRSWVYYDMVSRNRVIRTLSVGAYDLLRTADTPRATSM